MSKGHLTAQPVPLPFVLGNPTAFLWAVQGCQELWWVHPLPSTPPILSELCWELAASGVWAVPATEWLPGELQPHPAPAKEPLLLGEPHWVRGRVRGRRGAGWWAGSWGQQEWTCTGGVLARRVCEGWPRAPRGHSAADSRHLSCGLEFALR